MVGLNKRLSNHIPTVTSTPPRWLSERGVSGTRKAHSNEWAFIITIGQPSRLSQKSQQFEPLGEHRSVGTGLRS
jgi:hypothetical protein